MELGASNASSSESFASFGWHFKSKNATIQTSCQNTLELILHFGCKQCPSDVLHLILCSLKMSWMNLSAKLLQNQCKNVTKQMQTFKKCTKHKIKTFVTKNCKSSFSFLLDRFTVGCSSCWALWHEKEWPMIFNVCAKNARVSTPFTVSCSVWTCKHVT